MLMMNQIPGKRSYLAVSIGDSENVHGFELFRRDSHVYNG